MLAVIIRRMINKRRIYHLFMVFIYCLFKPIIWALFDDFIEIYLWRQ